MVNRIQTNIAPRIRQTPAGVSGITDVVKGTINKVKNVVTNTSDDVQERFEQYQKNVPTPGTIQTTTQKVISRETTTAPVATDNTMTVNGNTQPPIGFTHPVAIGAGLIGGALVGWGTYALRAKNGNKGLVVPIIVGLLGDAILHYAAARTVYYFKNN